MASTTDIIVQILDGVIAGTITAQVAQQYRDQVAAMAAAGTDPTADQWSALFADIDTQTAQLDAADKALGG